MTADNSYKNQLVEMISGDEWSMQILEAVRSLDLTDWAIGAGFVRGLVWDHLSGFSRSAMADVDVLYFDPEKMSQDFEKQAEKLLMEMRPDIPWSVKNQARMHLRNKSAPYKNTENAISYWLETPTAVAVRLEADDQLTILAPHGLDDLFQMIVRPTPAGVKNRDQFEKRLEAKSWREKWPSLKVFD